MLNAFSASVSKGLVSVSNPANVFITEPQEVIINELNNPQNDAFIQEDGMIEEKPEQNEGYAVELAEVIKECANKSISIIPETKEEISEINELQGLLGSVADVQDDKGNLTIHNQNEDTPKGNINDGQKLKVNGGSQKKPCCRC